MFDRKAIMKKLFGVYCTDGVARDGTRLSISALDDMVWQGSEGRPLGVSHDFHRFIGWNVITGLYMSHEMSYVVGYSFLPDDDKEYEKLQTLRRGFYYEMVSKSYEEYKDEFLYVLSERGLADIHAKAMFQGIAMYGYEGILYKAFPNLKDHLDEDFMITLEYLLHDFDYLGQGVFAHWSSKLAVLLHPFFRRSFSRYNNYNFGFLEMLWQVFQNGNKSVKVLLDPDFIGYAPSFIQSHEYEYWYGPKYNDDIASIPQGLCHLENDETDKIYNNVKSTEFIWQKKDDGNKYQFEMEEVVDATLPALPKDIYGCRYLHAFYDFEKHEFGHFDGAIRCYEFEQMIERIGTSMDKMGHQAKYQKIFRMDGHISLDLWKGLITQYLCSNPLIYDYFGTPRPFPKEVANRASLKKETLNDYVPYVINQGDGIRLMVSYAKDVENMVEPRKFIALDESEIEDGKKSDIMEFAAIEVFKALNKVGADIVLPENIVYYISEDFYHFIPCIYHADSNLSSNLQRTLQGIRLLVNQHVKNGDNDRYSFSLSWNIEGKYVCIAFMGHVADLNKWLNTFESIPTDRNGMKGWLEQQNSYIHANGNDFPNPINDNHIKSDGVLFFQRHDIKEHVNIQDMQFDPKYGLKGEFQIDDNTFLHNQLSCGKLTFVPKLVVYDALDLTANESYMKTLSSSVFHETTYKLDCKMMGFNWATEARPICITPTE